MDKYMARLTLLALLLIAAGEFTCAYEQHVANGIGNATVSALQGPQQPPEGQPLIVVPRSEQAPDDPEDATPPKGTLKQLRSWEDQLNKLIPIVPLVNNRVEEGTI